MPPSFSSTWRACAIALRTAASHAGPSSSPGQEDRKDGDRLCAGFLGGRMPLWEPTAPALAEAAGAMSATPATTTTDRLSNKRNFSIRLTGIAPNANEHHIKRT